MNKSTTYQNLKHRRIHSLKILRKKERIQMPSRRRNKKNQKRKVIKIKAKIDQLENRI